MDDDKDVYVSPVQIDEALAALKKRWPDEPPEELRKGAEKIAKAIAKQNAAVDVQVQRFIELIFQVMPLALQGGADGEWIINWAIELAQVCGIDMEAFNEALPANIARLKSAGDH